jgi:hypothetical protein
LALLLWAHGGYADGLAQVAIAVAQEDYEAAATALAAFKPTDEETTQAAKLWGLALRFGQGEKVPVADCGEAVTPPAVVAQTKPLPRLFAVARLAAVASGGDLDAARQGALAVLDAAVQAGRLKDLTPQPDVLQIDLSEQDRRAWQPLRAEQVEPWQVWWGLAHLAFAVGRSQPWGGPTVDGFGLARALLDRARSLAPEEPEVWRSRALLGFESREGVPTPAGMGTRGLPPLELQNVLARDRHAAYQRLLELAPEDVDALLAAGDATQVAARFPDSAEAQWAVVQALSQRHGDTTALLAACEAAWKLNPERPGLAVRSFDLALEREAWEAAWMWWQRIPERDRRSNMRRLLGAYAAASAGQVAEALTLVKVLRLPAETEKPSNEAVDALLLEALCLVEQGDLETARGNLAQFLTWRPGHLPARLLLATLWQTAGEAEQARKLIAESTGRQVDLRAVSYGSVRLIHQAQVARLAAAHPDWRVLAAWQAGLADPRHLEAKLGAVWEEFAANE